MQPTPRAVLLAALGLPFALIPAIINPQLWTMWLGFGIFALAALMLDTMFSLARRELLIAVELPSILYIGGTDSAVLKLDAKRSARVEILPEFDAYLQAQPALQIDVMGDVQVQIPLIPTHRGTAEFIAVWLRWTGPLGLIRRSIRHSIEIKIPIVPNIRAVRAAAIELLNHRSALVGPKTQSYIGAGSEFASLQEYRQGMDHRTMDWRSSARHRKLICREYQAERNHQIILAFDTGRLMGEPLGGIPKLDAAINAGLLLALYCLKTGDRVGLYGFDEHVQQYLEPQGGLRALHRIQHAAAGLDYGTAETNFTLGLTHLATRLRRRSLVIVLTDFVDTITAGLMVDNLSRLARRHLVVFVSLRDPELSAIVTRAPKSLDDMHRAVVARDLIDERDLVIKQLRRVGVSCIDAAPSQVSTTLINRYLQIKQRELVG